MFGAPNLQIMGTTTWRTETSLRSRWIARSLGRWWWSLEARCIVSRRHFWTELKFATEKWPNRKRGKVATTSDFDPYFSRVLRPMECDVFWINWGYLQIFGILLVSTLTWQSSLWILVKVQTLLRWPGTVEGLKEGKRPGLMLRSQFDGLKPTVVVVAKKCQLAMHSLPATWTWLMFMRFAWLVKDGHFMSSQLPLAKTFESWFRSSCHPRKGEVSVCITTPRRLCSTKPCKSKVLEEVRLYPALSSQPICALHGVLSQGSPRLKKNLRWKAWPAWKVFQKDIICKTCLRPSKAWLWV